MNITQKEYLRKWRLEHKAESVKYVQKYFRTHPEKYILNRAKQSAKAKNIEFNLEVSDIIIPKVCPLLGIKLELNLGEGKKKRHNSPSLDRLDSTKGYIKGNVWIISDRANRMKNDATKEELIIFAHNVMNLFEIRMQNV